MFPECNILEKSLDRKKRPELYPGGVSSTVVQVLPRTILGHSHSAKPCVAAFNSGTVSKGALPTWDVIYIFTCETFQGEVSGADIAELIS